MTAAISREHQAREWARRLERRTADRAGISIADARKDVAARLRASPGALENLIRERTKGVRLWLYEALRAAVIDELKREIEAHEHELAALTGDLRGRPAGSVAAVETSLARLTADLGEIGPAK